MDTPYACSLVVGSAVLFQSVGTAVSKLKPPTSVDPKNAWKWKNTIMSVIHASIAGIWTASIVFTTPMTEENIMESYTLPATLACCFSFGYFIYDAADCLRHDPVKMVFVLCHHFIIFACFSTVLATHTYMLLTNVSLSLEVNSVFLHMRMLLKLAQCPRKHPFYIVNNIFNIVTYIYFRLYCVPWMLYWSIVHRDIMIPYIFNLLSFSLVGMTIINTVLFGMMLNTDFFKKAKTSKVEREENTVLLNDSNHNVYTKKVH